MPTSECIYVEEPRVNTDKEIGGHVRKIWFYGALQFSTTCSSFEDLQAYLRRQQGITLSPPNEKEQISICLYMHPHICVRPCLFFLSRDVKVKYGLIDHMTLALTLLTK